MAAYFFDSSAIVKRYIKETGTAWTVNIFRPRSHNQVFVSEVTLVEVISALARRHRGLSARSADYGKRAAKRFQSAYDSKFFKTRVDLATVREAALLAEKYFLRGYDAVQLATAMRIEGERKSIGAGALTFVSADEDLNRAAQAEGLLVENPDNHR